MAEFETLSGIRSIRLSRLLVAVFTAAVLALDIGGWWVCRWLVDIVQYPVRTSTFGMLLGCLYSCSIPAYVLLYSMHLLLKNLQAGSVFVPGNVRLLQRISICCFVAAGICLLGAWWFQSLIAVTLAAAFVGLIVRIVKNVFEQAIRMKDELDYTV